MAKHVNTFNLLTIGQRGVGKTVFLIGCYVESKFQADLDKGYYLDFQPHQAATLENILNYVAAEEKYPPATLRNTNFNLSLKRRSSWTEQTICNFRWTDLPGEECNLHSSKSFQQLLLRSQACCLFLDLPSLADNKRSQFEATIDQAMAIASTVEGRGRPYPIAIVLTKGDLTQLGPISQIKIELGLQQFLARLDTIKAVYERFYSAVPICESPNNEVSLNPEGTIAPFLWLASQLGKIYNSTEPIDLETNLSENHPRTADLASVMKDLEQETFVAKPWFHLILSLISIGGIGLAALLIFSPSTFQPQSISKYFSNLYSETLGSNRDFEP